MNCLIKKTFNNNKKIFYSIFSLFSIQISFLLYKLKKNKTQKKIIITNRKNKSLISLFNNNFKEKIDIKKTFFNNNNSTSFLNNGKKLILNFINPNNILYNIFKIKNYFNIETIDDLNLLKEKFLFLKNPKNKIIILTQNAYKLINKKLLTNYQNFHTKIFIIKNKEIINYLKINDDKLNIYFPSKLPFILENNQELLKENNYKKFIQNELTFTLDIPLFRNEYLIKKHKLILYKNNVNKLAELDHNKISENLKKNGKHLFIFIPNYDFLNKKEFENLLLNKEIINNFNDINITTNKKFCKLNNLYQNNLENENVPQIFLINNKNNKNKLIYKIAFNNIIEDLEKFKENNLNLYEKSNNLNKNFLTFVEEINSENFNNKILNDDSFNEAVIELFKENCPACFIYGKTFDHLSQKLNKHNIKKLKLFRIDCNKNELNFLGTFNEAPAYIFIKKNNKKIENINFLYKKNLINCIKSNSNLNLNNIKYNSNITYGYFIYKNNLFLKNNYDADIDLL